MNDVQPQRTINTAPTPLTITADVSLHAVAQHSHDDNYTHDNCPGYTLFKFNQELKNNSKYQT